MFPVVHHPGSRLPPLRIDAARRLIYTQAIAEFRLVMDEEKPMPSRMQRWIGGSFTIISAVLLALAGCNKEGDEAKPSQPAVKLDNLGKSIQAQPVARIKTPDMFSFKDAVILDPPPAGEQRPPDSTINGKNVGKLFETIADDLWDKVTFTNNDG